MYLDNGILQEDSVLTIPLSPQNTDMAAPTAGGTAGLRNIVVIILDAQVKNDFPSSSRVLFSGCKPIDFRTSRTRSKNMVF